MSLMSTIETEIAQATISETCQDVGHPGHDTGIRLGSMSRIEETVLENQMDNFEESNSRLSTEHPQPLYPSGLSDSDIDNENNHSLVNPIHRFDNKHGAIRDIRYVQNTFLLCIITPQTILSLENQAKFFVLFWSLKKLLLADGFYKVSHSTLDSIELVWTGNTRQRDFQNKLNQMYYSASCFSAFFSDKWEQTWDLTLIAIEETAMLDFCRWLFDQEELEELNISDVPTLRSIEAFERFLHPSARDTFAMCKEDITYYAVASHSDETLQFEFHYDEDDCVRLRFHIIVIHNALREIKDCDAFATQHSTSLRCLDNSPWSSYDHEHFTAFYSQCPPNAADGTKPLAVCISLENEEPQICVFLLQPFKEIRADNFADHAENLLFYIPEVFFTKRSWMRDRGLPDDIRQVFEKVWNDFFNEAGSPETLVKRLAVVDYASYGVTEKVFSQWSPFQSQSTLAHPHINPKKRCWMLRLEFAS